MENILLTEGGAIIGTTTTHPIAGDPQFLLTTPSAIFSSTFGVINAAQVVIAHSAPGDFIDSYLIHLRLRCKIENVRGGASYALREIQHTAWQP